MLSVPSIDGNAMKITIVMGFFLPMPPAAGGATEKSWHGLAREFVQRGHDVTVISRSWPGWPEEETIAGVRYVRLPGFDHTPRLRTNLWRDLRWSWRVWWRLPAADVTIVNCIALPVLLGWIRKRAGRIAVMTGRTPKGQYHLYRRIDHVLAVSSPVADAIRRENPTLAQRSVIVGYPIACAQLDGTRPVDDTAPVTLGYVGRLHKEKGLELLAAAAALLAQRSDLPPWRLVLSGPSDVARGGSGPEFLAKLQSQLSRALPADRFAILPAAFDPDALAQRYREIDLFCYPSLAEHGETFGVAVAEAMAAGAVPVVSALSCFEDFVQHRRNGIVFDHRAPDAPQRFADALAPLITDSSRRRSLAGKAKTEVQRYDFPRLADRLLDVFSPLK